MKKFLAVLSALLVLIVPLHACQKNNGDSIRVYTLTGTTGFGMAKLMEDAEKGCTANPYTFTKETDPTLVRDAILSGEADIAALPTNVAAMLYNATDGDVQVLALNTKGVLHLISPSAAPITSLEELSGKTVFCPAQNPAFIMKALIEKAGVENVTLDSTTYAKPEELREAVAGGLVELAILPEPMVTIALNVARQHDLAITASLDVTAAWNRHFPADSLVQGCVVARTAYIKENPEKIAVFLSEYEASVAFVMGDYTKGGDVIARMGLFSAAAVAQNALPRCNLCFVTGSEMKMALAAFLAEMPSASIGGALPGEDFYYLP